MRVSGGESSGDRRTVVTDVSVLSGIDKSLPRLAGNHIYYEQGILMSLTDVWKKVRDRMASEKSGTPASEVIPRMRDSEKVRVLAARQVVATDNTPSVREMTPFASEIAESTPAPASLRPSQEVFPSHYRLLVSELTKRGENMTTWQFTDSRDMGVSEAGHSVAFTLQKIGSGAVVKIEVTMYKGQLAKVRAL